MSVLTAYKIEDFLEKYDAGLTEYCPVTVAWDGTIYDSREGHLQVMVQLSGDEHALEKVPEGKSPLFYFVKELKCVLVDYENQVFCENLSQEQEAVLESLEQNRLIHKNRMMLHAQNI